MTPFKRSINKNLCLPKDRKSNIKSKCPMCSVFYDCSLWYWKDRPRTSASQLHSCIMDNQMGSYLTNPICNPYRDSYLLKIFHCSASPEMHVNSSYAKWATCLFRCQVQKVFRRKIKGIWLDKWGKVCFLWPSEMNRRNYSYYSPGVFSSVKHLSDQNKLKSFLIMLGMDAL